MPLVTSSEVMVSAGSMQPEVAARPKFKTYFSNDMAV
jgi:hypothetical protein